MEELDTSFAKNTVEVEKESEIYKAENEDSGYEWDTDLDCFSENESPRYSKPKRQSPDSLGQSEYLRACERLGIHPASYFLRNIDQNEIKLGHHGIGPQGTKALSACLAKNRKIKKLDLQGNGVGEEGTESLCRMLLNNCYITVLNLSGNNLGARGACAIGSMLEENIYLQWLDLSSNGFMDKDARYIADGLKENVTLRYLNLSKNSFCEIGGKLLGPALATNDGLITLDLSWNQLRLKGATAICEGLTYNMTLESLDLSWNGFGDDGAAAMGRALRNNNSLTELDLSHNRISKSGAVEMARGLLVNKCLKIMKVGHNHLETQGSFFLLNAVKNNEDTAVEELHLNNMLVNQDFLDFVSQYRDENPEKRVKCGVAAAQTGLWSKPKQSDQSRSARRKYLFSVLKDYLIQRRLRAVDLFNEMQKDKSESMGPDELFRGLRKAKVPLKDSELKELIYMIDKDSNGEILYWEFAAVNK